MPSARERECRVTCRTVSYCTANTVFMEPCAVCAVCVVLLSLHSVNTGWGCEQASNEWFSCGSKDNGRCMSKMNAGVSEPVSRESRLSSHGMSLSLYLPVSLI